MPSPHLDAHNPMVVDLPRGTPPGLPPHDIHDPDGRNWPAPRPPQPGEMVYDKRHGVFYTVPTPLEEAELELKTAAALLDCTQSSIANNTAEIDKLETTLKHARADVAEAEKRHKRSPADPQTVADLTSTRDGLAALEAMYAPALTHLRDELDDHRALLKERSRAAANAERQAKI